MTWKPLPQLGSRYSLIQIQALLAQGKPILAHGPDSCVLCPIEAIRRNHLTKQIEGKCSNGWVPVDSAWPIKCKGGNL